MTVEPSPAFYGRFGRALADQRRAAGLSQQTVADRVGLSRASVANIEAGRQGSVALHAAVALASAVGCALPDLVASTRRDVIHLASQRRGSRPDPAPEPAETAP